MYNDFFNEYVYPNILKKNTQIICDGMKFRNDFKYGLGEGHPHSCDHRYLCEYVYPKKIKKAINEIATMYEEQCNDLKELGIGTYDD